MASTGKFKEELTKRIYETVERMNIPTEFEDVFFTLFSTFLNLFYLERLFDHYKKTINLETKGFIVVFHDFIDPMFLPLLQAMKTLGSSFIETEQFMGEIGSLKSFCDCFIQEL